MRTTGTDLRALVALALLLLAPAALAAPTGMTTSQAKTAAPTAVDLSRTTNAEGTSSSFARADHVHAVTNAATALPTCNAGIEGREVWQTATGGTGTLARTRLCRCTSDGAVSPAYAWQDVATDAIGTATTCETDTTLLSFLTAPTAGCYASGSLTASNGATLTFSRGSSALCWTGSAYATCTSNQACVEANSTGSVVYGLRIEPARTNIYPTPAAPAAGTATATVTGQHYFSVVGSGSQQLTFNSATGTGLPCTATQAAPCSFSVSATGTLTLAAVTGSLTVGSIEAGAFRTSPMPAASRAAELATMTNPVTNPNVAAWCWRIKVTPENRTWRDTIRVHLAWGTNLGANSFQTYEDSAGERWYYYDSTPALRYIDTGGVQMMTGSTARTFIGCVNGNEIDLQADGIPMSARSGSPTGAGVAPTSAAATFAIGSTTGTQYHGQAYYRDLAIITGRKPTVLGGTAKQAGGGGRAFAALGDSITQGFGTSPAWVTTLAGLVGADGTNKGVSGYRTDQILSIVIPSDVAIPWQGSVLVLAGVNDINSYGATAAATWANLQTIYGLVKARGARVVALTILPCGGAGGCTAGEDTERRAVNASIMAACAADPTMACVDTATFMDDGTYGGTPGNLRSIWTSDGLHPNQAGADAMAPYVKTVAFP